MSFFSMLLAALLIAVEAAPPGADDLKPQVDRLVRQLDSPAISTRTEAENQLIQLGPRILELLPAFGPQSPATDAQRREAVGRVRERLERALAETSIQASTITLDAKDRPLSEVLAEFSKQSGNKIIDLRGKMGGDVTNPKLTLHFNKTPFWAAFDETLDQAGLALYNYDSSDSLGVINRPDGELPRAGRASYAGPLRLEPTRLFADRNLRNPKESSLKLTTVVSWEPRMRPISIQLPLGQLHAVDDQKNVLSITENAGQLGMDVDRVGTAAELEIPLENPPRAAQSIARISGKLQALLPARIETFEFGDLKNAKPPEQRRAGVTVIVDEVRKNDAAWDVHVRVKFEKPGGALESFRLGWVYANEAYMLGPDKKKIENAGQEPSRETPDEVGIVYHFLLENGIDGCTFVYKTPAALNNGSFDFEFKNLPLP